MQSENFFEDQIRAKIESTLSAEDPAHDILHLNRVVSVAKSLCRQEGGKLEVVMPAAWLHDFVIVPKDDPRRAQASRLSAEKAVLFLREISYPEKYLSEIAHAIEAHSFSGGIVAETLEAKIVQDADRLDGLGAIGIARCFVTAGLLRRPLYSQGDAFCEHREPSDREFTLDHFYQKLLRVAETLNTNAAKTEGARRAGIMRRYLADLRCEVESLLS